MNASEEACKFDNPNNYWLPTDGHYYCRTPVPWVKKCTGSQSLCEGVGAEPGCSGCWDDPLCGYVEPPQVQSGVDYSASTTEAITATAGNVIGTFYDSLALLVAVVGTIIIIKYGIGGIAGTFRKKI